ncbi:MAG: DNA polymerase/3'-5' exonuclease PolX [Eubacteriales bacterium]|jgi:DNA polymerase (family 10)
MLNFEIALAFQELADLLEYKGEDFFKIRAYRRAARVIACLDEPVGQLFVNKKLLQVPGIGKNIASKIEELLTTGKMNKLEEMRKGFHPGLMEIMNLPGIGPKRAGILIEQLKVASLDELDRAARSEYVRKLPGMGAKTEQEIIRNIQMLQDNTGKHLLGQAKTLAAELCDLLAGFPGVKKIEVTGGVRRWQETVSIINLLADTGNPEELCIFLAGHPRVKEVQTCSKDRVKISTRWGIDVELLTVDEKDNWAALLWSTGSTAHYQKLTSLARMKGFELSARGFADSQGKMIPLKSEGDLYDHLDLPFIPPELREDKGEIEYCLEAGRLPDLIDLKDIKGDLHVHSNWSDGANSIEQIADQARGLGYSYVAITDHSASLKIAGGLPAGKLLEQREYIRELNKKYENFRVLHGIEVDILSGGGLDCPEEILKEMDIVIASVHTGFRQDRAVMTERIISAIRNKNVDVVGHLTGRLIGRRKGYEVDAEKIFQAAKIHGTFMEINSSPERLDLNEDYARLAKQCGLKLVINTDAHDLRRMKEIPFGVAVARRAWLSPADVLNTADLGDLLNTVSPSHKK